MSLLIIIAEDSCHLFLHSSYNNTVDTSKLEMSQSSGKRRLPASPAASDRVTRGMMAQSLKNNDSDVDVYPSDSDQTEGENTIEYAYFLELTRENDMPKNGYEFFNKAVYVNGLWRIDDTAERRLLHSLPDDFDLDEAHWQALEDLYNDKATAHRFP